MEQSFINPACSGPHWENISHWSLLYRPCYVQSVLSRPWLDNPHIIKYIMSCPNTTKWPYGYYHDKSHLVLFDSMWHHFSWTRLKSLVSKWLKSHFVTVIWGCLWIQFTVSYLRMSISINYLIVQSTQNTKHHRIVNYDLQINKAMDENGWQVPVTILQLTYLGYFEAHVISLEHWPQSWRKLKADLRSGEDLRSDVRSGEFCWLTNLNYLFVCVEHYTVNTNLLSISYPKCDMIKGNKGTNLRLKIKNHSDFFNRYSDCNQ